MSTIIDLRPIWNQRLPFERRRDLIVEAVRESPWWGEGVEPNSPISVCAGHAARATNPYDFACAMETLCQLAETTGNHFLLDI